MKSWQANKSILVVADDVAITIDQQAFLKDTS
jgi:hypothetical protein